MNLRTKAAGLIAATALSISLATGAVAGETSVTLQQNDDPTAGCQLGPADSIGANFGTFTWNGTAYTGGNSVELNIPLTQNLQPQALSCAVNLTATALTDEDDNTIAPSTIQVTGGGQTNAPLDATTPVTLTYTNTLNTGTHSATLTMSGLGAQPTGDYKGTLIITLNNG